MRGAHCIIYIALHNAKCKVELKLHCNAQCKVQIPTAKCITSCIALHDEISIALHGELSNAMHNAKWNCSCIALHDALCIALHYAKQSSLQPGGCQLSVGGLAFDIHNIYITLQWVEANYWLQWWPSVYISSDNLSQWVENLHWR